MRLIVIGCEYAGKTALATAISKWMIETMGLTVVVWHDHYVVPRSMSSSTGVGGHLTVLKPGADAPDMPYGQYVIKDADAFDPEDEEREKDVLALKPWLLEQLQRHMIWRHLHHSLVRDEADYLSIDLYYADAVYAPLYYGYGEPGSFADRSGRARSWDREILEMAPDTVLVQVKASADVIRERMRSASRPRSLLKEDDIELVLDRFQEEYDNSLIPRRFTLDTTSASVEESLQDFLGQMWRYLSKVDRLRMISRPDADSLKPRP